MNTRRKKGSIILEEGILPRIRWVRGYRVILDGDLATLYGVTTKRLNEQVRRNSRRFPPDFGFQITREEHDSLRSQFATLEKGRGRHPKYLPWAFTEHGAIMAAGVLNSGRAIAVSIYVVRAFVRLRRLLTFHADLARKVDALEKKYDSQFRVVFEAIRQLMAPPLSKKRRIGQGWPVPEDSRGATMALPFQSAGCGFLSEN